MNRHQVFEFKELKIKNHQLQSVALTKKFLNENYYWRYKKCIARIDYNVADSVKHYLMKRKYTILE